MDMQLDSVTDAQGRVNFRGFHGTYEVTFTPPNAAPTVRIIQLQPDPEIAQFTFQLD